MTKQEVIEKAIKKATDAGLTGYWAERYRFCKELDEMEFLADGNVHEEGHSLEELLFNHDFAKALWGNGLPDGGGDYYYDGPDTNWEWHLQQMVIAEDPIKYLEENI